LKAEQAAKKDSKKRARDDAQIGSDGLKSGGGSSSSSSSSSGSDGSSSSLSAVAVARLSQRLCFSLSLCPRGWAVLLARNKGLEFFSRALVSDSFWVRFPAAF
jgi:hypothetical protein